MSAPAKFVGRVSCCRMRLAQMSREGCSSLFVVSDDGGDATPDLRPVS